MLKYLILVCRKIHIALSLLITCFAVQIWQYARVLSWRKGSEAQEWISGQNKGQKNPLINYQSLVVMALAYGAADLDSSPRLNISLSVLAGKKWKILFLCNLGTETFGNFSREENLCIAQSRNAFRLLHLFCIFFSHAYFLCKVCLICDIGKMLCQLSTPKMTSIHVLSSQMSSSHLPVSFGVNAMGIQSFWISLLLRCPLAIFLQFMAGF